VPVPDRSLQATMALLDEAVREGTRLTLTYLDPTGRITERIVDPRALESGFLSAYDERARVTRTFAVRNIAGVTPAA
jgi:predicted DNA-binding transcriptional regulator YafY